MVCGKEQVCWDSSISYRWPASEQLATVNCAALGSTNLSSTAGCSGSMCTQCQKKPHGAESACVYAGCAYSSPVLAVCCRQLPGEVVGQVAAQVCRYVGDDLEPKGLTPQLPHTPPQQQQHWLLGRWQVLPADYTPPSAAVHYRRLQLPSAPGAAEDPLTGEGQGGRAAVSKSDVSTLCATPAVGMHPGHTVNIIHSLHDA
jgi:hypothetical protein